VKQVQTWIEEQPAEGVARLLAALAGRRDSTALLDAINVPTLVLTGEEDPIATSAEAREWAARIPGARFEVIEKCGHLPPLEQAAAFAGRIADSLDRLEGR
jgi:pimeloyl-ACP methyl ester carboxylesterase